MHRQHRHRPLLGLLALAALLPLPALSVDAGADQELTLFYNTASFQASVAGATVPADQLVWEWRLWSGPASASVYALGGSGSSGQAFVEDPGVYVVAVTVSDGASVASDTVTLSVNPWPPSLPGRLEAENADLGNGLGYRDLTAGNSGGAYRDDDLDVVADTGSSNGHHVTAIASGEWMDYGNLSQSGFYDLTLRVAGSGRVRLLADGRDLAGSVDLGSGAGWRNVLVRNVELYGYIGTLRLEAENGGFDLDFLDFAHLGSEPVPTGPTLAINCGGSEVITIDGTRFAADTGASGGRTYATGDAIAGSEDDALYRSERYGDFAYAFPVPNGVYQLELHLAEIYFTAAGRRVFDLQAEGTLVADDLDLYATVGHDTALVLSVLVEVRDGSFDLSSSASINHAKLAAFALYPAVDASN